jgi:hypothetical protein
MTVSIRESWPFESRRGDRERNLQKAGFVDGIESGLVCCATIYLDDKLVLHWML